METAGEGTLRQGSRSALAGKTATEIAALVRHRELSPAEVVRDHLERIAALEPEIHAFQIVRAEQALSEAAALAARPDLGELPLAEAAVKDRCLPGGLGAYTFTHWLPNSGSGCARSSFGFPSRYRSTAPPRGRQWTTIWRRPGQST